MVDLKDSFHVTCGTCGCQAVRHQFTFSLPNNGKAVVFHDTHTSRGSKWSSDVAVLEQLDKRYEQLQESFVACSTELIGWGIGAARITRVDFASDSSTACKPRSHVYPIISWQIGGSKEHRSGLPTHVIGEIDSALIIEVARQVLKCEIQLLQCERCDEIIGWSSEEFERCLLSHLCLGCRWDLIEKEVGPHVRSVAAAITNEEVKGLIREIAKRQITHLKALTERGVIRGDSPASQQEFRSRAENQEAYWRKVDGEVKEVKKSLANTPISTFALHIAVLTAQRRYLRGFLRKRFRYDVCRQRFLRGLPAGGATKDPSVFNAALQSYFMSQVAFMDGLAAILLGCARGKNVRDALIGSVAAMTQALNDRHRTVSFAPLSSPFPDLKESALTSLTGWVAYQMSRRNNKRQKQAYAVGQQSFSDGLWDRLPQCVQLAWHQGEPHVCADKGFLSRVTEMLEAERLEVHRQSDIVRRARNRTAKGERVLISSETVSFSPSHTSRGQNQMGNVDMIDELIDPKTEEFALRETAREEERQALLDLIDQLAHSDQLPSREKELLNLRLQHPDATNLELAERMIPPVEEGTVWAMNNRIKNKARKIVSPK